MAITLCKALWYRLKTRNNFLLALDDISKNFIWKLVCNDCAIEFFLLKESRPPLVDYNRYNYIDPEVEIICEPVSCNFSKFRPSKQYFPSGYIA